MERLHSVLAARGVASRRAAEEMIATGRVRVDGVVVTELGTKVDPETQKIEVDGMLIPNPRRRYVVLHKPRGYITTMSDERDRQTVMDLVRVSERVVPVGRLDRQTEGLLLLTNDGEVAHRVMHPRYEIDKEYEALLDGHPPAAVLHRVRQGIVVDGQRAQPVMVRPLRNAEDGTVVRIVIHEGRNRVVRRMFEEVGYPVLRLIRTRIGPLQLGAIPRGRWRDLTDGELKALREALHLGDEDVAWEERGARTRRAEPSADHGAAQGAEAPVAPGRGEPARRPAQPGGNRPQPRPAGRRVAQSREGTHRTPSQRRARQPGSAAGGAPAHPSGPKRNSRPDRDRRPRPPRPANGARPERDGRGASKPRRPARQQAGAGRRATGGKGTQGKPRPTSGGQVGRRKGTGGKRSDAPLHDRNRRAGGGGEEHDRRDRRDET
jgi:23S rRNA pseudouridine2605 synthase